MDESLARIDSFTKVKAAIEEMPRPWNPAPVKFLTGMVMPLYEFGSGLLR